MAIKILYVEDEAVLAKIVKESLEKLSYHVSHAIDGEAGLKLFSEFQPDLCLLDVMMPKMDGFTLGKKIRKLNTVIPIIFLTAKLTTEDVLEGFSSGGNDYLRKPFSMQELNVRIENLLKLANGVKSASEGSKESISIGQYTYLKIRQELKLGEESIKLSYREHELLVKLVEAGQAVVERRQLLKDIWGDDSFFQSRNLDVYIRKLRQYFAQDSNVQIITLKGVGYRFVY